MKRKYVADFMCAFIITALLFMCLGLLTGQGFLDEAVAWDAEENTLCLFGTQLCFEGNILHAANTLFKFNDAVFFEGFSDIINDVTSSALKYAGDVFAFFLAIGKTLVGAAETGL